MPYPEKRAEALFAPTGIGVPQLNESLRTDTFASPPGCAAENSLNLEMPT
jgi:hypothetical protein